MKTAGSRQNDILKIMMDLADLIEDMHRHETHKNMIKCFSDIQGLLMLSLAFFLCTAFVFGEDAEDKYEKGMRAFKSNDYMQALQYLDQSLKKDPDYTLAKALRPWIHLRLNRVGEAESYFREAYNRNPQDINAVEGMAWVHYTKEEYEQARTFFEQQAALASGHILKNDFWRYKSSDKIYLLSVRSDAHYGLALIAQKKGDKKAAVAHFEKALQDPNDFMPVSFILIPLVDYYFENRAYEKAADLLEKSLREQKKPGFALMLKAGWAYYLAGDYSKADRVFQRSLILRREAPESLYGLAWCAYRKGRYWEAKSFMQRAIAKNPYYTDVSDVQDIMLREQPDFFTLWKDFGISYYVQGNYTAARYKLDIYLEKHPDDLESLLAMGWSSRWSGHLGDAERAFKRLIRLKGSQAIFHVGLGSTYLAMGRMEASKKEFNRALSINRKESNALNGLGHYYLSQGEKEKAKRYFKKSVQIEPENYDSNNQLALIHYQEEAYETAILYYNRLVKIKKKAVAPYNMLGWCYFHLKRYEESERVFLKSKALAPNLADCRYGLGLIYAARGIIQEAKQELVASIDIAPAYSHTKALEDLIASGNHYHDLYLKLGWSYYRHRAYYKALEAFNKFPLSDEEGRFSCIRGQAWCHYYLGRYGKAYDLFSRVLENNKDNVDARAGMGLVLFKKKEFSQSMRLMKAVLEDDPRRTVCWRTMAAIHEIKGESVKAEQIYARIKEIAPRPKEIHNEKGWQLYAEGRYEDAIEAFNQSVRKAPRLGAPHYGLGLSRLHLGEKGVAKDHLTKGIYLQPRFMDNQPFYQILASDARLRSLRSDLGWSYFKKQHYNDALYHFEEMLEQEPDLTEASLGKGAVLYTRGDYQGAIEHYQKLMHEVSAHSDSWDKWSSMLSNLGWCHYFQKDYQKAATLFQRLQDYHKGLNHIAPLNGLGWCFLKMGEQEKARKIFLRSLWILPGNYLAQLGMNLLYADQDTAGDAGPGSVS